MSYKRYFLILFWLSAVINSLASDNQRDSILSQITGAKIPEAVINIKKWVPMETGQPIVCLHSKRQ